jgi:uncharacterized hydrophobic protein (TIGR00271 family)
MSPSLLAIGLGLPGRRRRAVGCEEGTAVLTLQMYAPLATVPDVVALLRRQSGVDHVVLAGATADGDAELLTADVVANSVDTVLPLLVAAGVSGEEITVLHTDGSRPLAAAHQGDLPSWSGGPLAWADLAAASRQYSRAVPQYLAYMVCAGIIAAFGILTRNSILIVGAMAISPDLWPLCATCIGMVTGRRRLAARAFAALIIGLAAAGLAAFLITVPLRWAGYGPTTGDLADGGLGVLPTVNVVTVVVAFVAGIAGILAFETRSSSAVGVAISITTIPAAAFAGAAAAVTDWADAVGALSVLAVNILMLLTAGTITLLVQRRRRRTE